MGLMKNYFNNTCKPEGVLGNLMLKAMNVEHTKVSVWGISHLPDRKPVVIADLGCGGGKNAQRLMKKFPSSKLIALDYSEVSVKKTQKLNQEAIKQRRCKVVQGDVSDLPMKTESIDLATAFETIYFWPGPLKSFQEVYRILKKGGSFMIVNESDGTNEKDQKWVDMIDKMQMYSADEIEKFLREAGFSKVSVFRKKKNFWIGFLAEK